MRSLWVKVDPSPSIGVLLRREKSGTEEVREVQEDIGAECQLATARSWGGRKHPLL